MLHAAVVAAAVVVGPAAAAAAVDFAAVSPGYERLKLGRHVSCAVLRPSSSRVCHVSVEARQLQRLKGKLILLLFLYTDVSRFLGLFKAIIHSNNQVKLNTVK